MHHGWAGRAAAMFTAASQRGRPARRSVRGLFRARLCGMSLALEVWGRGWTTPAHGLTKPQKDCAYLRRIYAMRVGGLTGISGAAVANEGLGHMFIRRGCMTATSTTRRVALLRVTMVRPVPGLPGTIRRKSPLAAASRRLAGDAGGFSVAWHDLHAAGPALYKEVISRKIEDRITSEVPVGKTIH